MGDEIRDSLRYSQLVYLLLLRRKRKLRFLISNFKHSTGLFELALLYFMKVTCFVCLVSNLEQPRGVLATCSSLPSTKKQTKLKDYNDMFLFPVLQKEVIKEISNSEAQ